MRASARAGRTASPCRSASACRPCASTASRWAGRRRERVYQRAPTDRPPRAVLTLEDMARELVAAALAAGARAADAVVAESDGLGVGVRLREGEKVMRSRRRRAGLRDFVEETVVIA